MRKILKAIGKALRRMLKAVARIGRYGIGFVDGLFTSLFDGGGPDGEDDVVVEEVAEAPAPAAQRPVSLPQLAKTGLLCMDSNRPLDELLDMEVPAQAQLRDWLLSLDEGGRRALRHVTMPALARHLDVKDVWRGPGLPLYPVRVQVVANTNAPALDAEARVSFKDALEIAAEGRVVQFRR